ncbi:MAG: phage antirepressor KilAC domain-containing protein [Erysipelotrichaceae bacterium]|nr:phage antirepressor KilAC domain-containing protein [Erysipelotrichaceae bacterium]
MNEILKIEINENQEPIVGGRELHEVLGIETPYKKWFDRMCEYGFIENQDYCTVGQKCPIANGGYQEITNHAIKLDMAKEIAMIQRNEKGRQVRKYFIEVEKDFNSPEKIMARALKLAENKINTLNINVQELEDKLEEQVPKVVFAEAVQTSENSILIGDLAKILRQNGYETGQNRLFNDLRNMGYLIKSGERKNMPTQRSMELGLFEVKERAVVNPDGSNRITRTTKVTGKGQIYFINKLIKEN